MTEKELVKVCIEYLSARGHFVWRNNSGFFKHYYQTVGGETRASVMRAGIVGSSDIIGIAKDGKFIAIECKVGKNTASPYQIDFIEKINNREGHAKIVYSLDEVVAMGL